MSNIAAERRRRQRISTMILCEIRMGPGPARLVRIRDLSECGIKIATTVDFGPDERLWVRLPGTTDWAIARVAWQAKGMAGLSFVRALELPEMAGARRDGDSSGRQPNAALRVRTA